MDEMQTYLTLIFVSSITIVLLLMFLLLEVTATRHKQDTKRREEGIESYAHDVKTPINSIRGFAEALGDGMVSDENKSKYIDIIKSECDRICRMTDDFVVSQKLGAKRISADTVKPYEILGEVLLAFEKKITEKNVSVDGLEEIESGDGKDITAMGDAELLHRAYYNIVSNAVKYVDDGGRIGVSIKSDDGQVVLGVSSTGGFEGDITRAFERNYRGKSDEEGSGLGLYNVKYIAELHKGSAEIKERGGETEVTMRIPQF